VSFRYIANGFSTIEKADTLFPHSSKAHISLIRGEFSGFGLIKIENSPLI
jgi:hypothetical protein